MTNLDSTLKSRDVTLPAKIRLVKAIINIAVFQTQGYLLKLRRASPLLCEARLRLPGGACSPGGARTSHCAGSSCCGARALGGDGCRSCSSGASELLLPDSKAQAAAAVVHGLSCSVARGTFLAQGAGPCLLRWQAGSLPLSHRRSS